MGEGLDIILLENILFTENVSLTDIIHLVSIVLKGLAIVDGFRFLQDNPFVY